MAEPWIRVHANLADKPIVWRVVDQLKVSQNEAIGLLVRFWGAMSQHGANGRVASLNDSQIEAWAGWRGKRGRFAEFVRANHTDEDGRVREWDDYAGALETRREKERDRKRRQRGQASGNGAKAVRDVPQDEPRDNPHDVARTGPGTVQPARANETIRDDTNSGQSINPAGEEERELAARLANDAERAALATIVAGAESAATCVMSLTAMLTGNDPAIAKPTDAQFGQALLDYNGKGSQWNPAYFRGFLKRAVSQDSRGSTTTNSDGARRSKPSGSHPASKRPGEPKPGVSPYVKAFERTVST
jgi:hypothetical protein